MISSPLIVSLSFMLNNLKIKAVNVIVMKTKTDFALDCFLKYKLIITFICIFELKILNNTTLICC